MTNKYSSIVGSIYTIGILSSITYKIRIRNIKLKKSVNEVKDDDYIISSFNGLINGAILGLFWPITFIGKFT